MKNSIKYVPLLSLFIVLTLTIGYSALNNVLHVSDVSAVIRAQADIRVTGVSVSDGTGGAVSTSEDYNVKDILVDFTLPENASITYKVKVTNFGNVEMGILSFTNLPSNITYTMTDYSLTDPICDTNDSTKCTLGAVKEFYITFSYAENGYDSSNENYSIIGHFDFEGFYNITYVNAPRGNNYKTKVMSHTEFVQDGVPAGGGTFKYTNSGSSLSGTYNLSNRIVTIPAENVTDDITITFRTLGQYINKLYNDGSKSSTTNDGVSYNRVTSKYLMNDREGGKVGVNEGNVRYYGTSAANYIYYNCKDYDNQSSSTCETWRILGVFNNKVKLLRNNPIGMYSWDVSANSWKNSSACKLLNSGFDSASVGGSLYWNAKSGQCYNGRNNAKTSCDFRSIGLQNSDTRDFITTETLHFTSPGTLLGGLVSITEMYRQERGEGSIYSANDKTWTGKIALMYVSDYYFSADLSKCNTKLFWMATNTSCTNSSWIKNDNNTWTISPAAINSENAWDIVNNGSAYYDKVYTAYSIWPALYLKTNTIFIGGNGTSSNPYKIYPVES